jgi:hypothetical protein
VSLHKFFGRRTGSARRPRPSTSPLQLEYLEDRTVPSLVAAYSFNEGTGTTTADASGHGNAGTLSNATWVQGKYGGGLKFTGAANSYVSIPDAAGLDLTAASLLKPGPIRRASPVPTTAGAP